MHAQQGEVEQALAEPRRRRSITNLSPFLYVSYESLCVRSFKWPVIFKTRIDQIFGRSRVNLGEIEWQLEWNRVKLSEIEWNFIQFHSVSINFIQISFNFIQINVIQIHSNFTQFHSNSFNFTQISFKFIKFHPISLKFIQNRVNSSKTNGWPPKWPYT